MDILGKFITKSQVGLAVKKYPKGKSPGIDSISMEIIQALYPSTFLEHLTDLYKLCTFFQTTPDRWNHSVIFPIPKTTSSRYINEYRPISLALMFRRIFEKVLLASLAQIPELATLSSFNVSQAGFRREFSTMTQALVRMKAPEWDTRPECSWILSKPTTKSKFQF